MQDKKDVARRPLKSRDTNWARAISRALIKMRAKPNIISIFSVVFGLLAGIALYRYGESIEGTVERCLVLCTVVAGVILRLLCNLFDGMVAVDGGFQSAHGELYNDLPDRIADTLIIVGLGYAAAQGDRELWPMLGWVGASAAIFTAYVRTLGAACGTTYIFDGIMAKQKRMAVVIGSCILSALLEPSFVANGTIFRWALVIIIAGSVWTSASRTVKIAENLTNLKK